MCVILSCAATFCCEREGKGDDGREHGVFFCWLHMKISRIPPYPQAPQRSSRYEDWSEPKTGSISDTPCWYVPEDTEQSHAAVPLRWRSQTSLTRLVTIGDS